MRTFDKLRDLPVVIESGSLAARVHPKGSFTRHSTVICLEGRGAEGWGEDVTYTPEDQLALQEAGCPPEVAGSYTMESFSARLEELPLWPSPPDQPAYRNYRRWGFESAALDLALRQAGRRLDEILERELRPLRFVVSMNVTGPQDMESLRGLLRHHPGMRLKLDATSGWTEEMFDELAGSGAVDVIDLKGAYVGTPVDQPPEALLYRRVVDTFPAAWIEDPALNDETRPILEPHMDRVAWDAIIHSIGDIQGLSHAPRILNFKPSRFGSLRSLLDAYDHCLGQGIRLYGGGQFELDVGRQHIQYLAALFHADAPNDVAPISYNTAPSIQGLPDSPLRLQPAPAGFHLV